MPIAVCSGWTGAAKFQVPLTDVTIAIFLTLAMLPIAAFVFGRLADRFGRQTIGASLAMDSIRAKARGAISDVLQACYPTGYLAASLVFALLYAWIGWCGMFMVGVLPELPVRSIRRNVKESQSRQPHITEDGIVPLLKRHWGLSTVLC